MKSEIILTIIKRNKTRYKPIKVDNYEVYKGSEEFSETKLIECFNLKRNYELSGIEIRENGELIYLNYFPFLFDMWSGKISQTTKKGRNLHIYIDSSIKIILGDSNED